MIPEEIYGVGGLLGLEDKDIQELLLENSNPDSKDYIDLQLSPANTYKNSGPGELYGTLSIKDFK